MRLTILALLFFFVGCASSPVTITYTPGVAGEGGLITAGEAAHSQLASVEVQPSAYGRQCFDLTIEPHGTVNVTYAVDASSDWAGIRALPLVVPEIVGAVMAAVGAPFELIGSLFGIERAKPQPPSALSACSALFEE